MTAVIEQMSLIIGGEQVPSAGAGVIEVFSPRDKSLVGVVPHASERDVDRAVAAARHAFDDGPWSRLPLAERVAVVRRIQAGLVDRAEEMARLITLQNGSPISLSLRSQALGAAAVYGAACDTAENFDFEERRAGLAGEMLILREPVGVVAAVIPWNVPQVMLAAKLAPALVAGCTVVVKPSPEAPLDSYLLAEVCAEAGLPSGVLSVLPADREVSAYLVAHRGVDKVAFTGSVVGGAAVMAAAAANITRVTLELGGKSAAILLDDADVAAAVPHLVAGCLSNSGQACIALTRVLAPRGRIDEVGATLARAFSGLVVGDPFDPATQIGPMASGAQLARVLNYIRLAEKEGARVLCGGGAPDGLESGWYVQPTLLGNVHNDMRIAREEVFGPVVCLIPFDDEADAIRLANDSEFGLCGAVFTRDLDRGLRVARQVRTGTFSVNSHRVDMNGPFGGYKRSGFGREFGPEGLESYLETKTVHLPEP